MIDFTQPRTIVVKLGTSVLIKDDGRLDKINLVKLHEQIAMLRSVGHRVVVVSSGAVGLAKAVLRRAERPVKGTSKQVLAAIGQLELMNMHREVVQLFDGVVAQVLLTRTDLASRSSYLNARNTLNGLLSMGVLPVVNENDSVSTEEIRFGDNDMLSALVGSAIDADLVVNLTQVHGLLAPVDGQEERAVVRCVERIDGKVRSWVSNTKTDLGTGGMETKLDAAEKIFEYGGAMVIAHAREPEVLAKIIGGQEVGTLFYAADRKSLRGKKRWVAHAALDAGSVTVDEGAGEALRHQGCSLLTIGVIGAEGRFGCGDIISIKNGQGDTIGRGLANFASDLLEEFFALDSDTRTFWMEAKDCHEFIHRDNLFVVGA